ncbi:MULTISPECIES: hypothetical protein [Kitasatospora]|uniref:Uncharacterized protein n=1 Tax=Kitasatospora setae (strain ATCC 33774 / DSM 43861 / JCM 3304 / KCC A-0304 / NBRC 14216 / KM-6054) TaxID=452652 RepID=E4NDT2_KITSK|nr:MULTISPECIES: hypothetical protein [Kitasatospora]BAJ29363.1 hypothetical protein KSE_35580 [Kitasatospora setae KM-6054]
MESTSGIPTEASTGSACPEWCDGGHREPSDWHYGSALLLTAPGSEGQPAPALLKVALMGEADPKTPGQILPSVDVEGMEEQALDAAGLEVLIARFERYVTELREFQCRYGAIARAAQHCAA